MRRSGRKGAGDRHPAAGDRIDPRPADLPGGDRAIVTRTEETLAAIGSAADLLRPGGMLAVVCYTGHDGAGDEAEAVVGFFTSLEGHRVGRYGMIATPSASPFLLISRKIR